ncbi:MAG: CotH kinase family protein, partial [Bacteroidaceae bacterium]|nr:CotH kinase family protein [Bacteroidaceae bacterium]
MKGLKRLLLLTIVILPPSIVRAGSNESALVINEIMPANIDVCMDPSFNYGSWIELYNKSAQDIDITGWYLSDDAADRQQCPLGNRSRIVKAGGFLTLWFGHLDDYCLNQIEFSMDYDSGHVYLFDTGGREICSVEYQTIPARISYARTTDGGDTWSMTGYPTPGATNTTSKFASAQLAAPKVNTDSRIYTGQMSFNVNVPQGATLYYTLNGSTPAPGKDGTYIGGSSFNVTGSEVYRFRLYKDGMLPSPVTTRSFIKTANNYGVPVVSIVTDREGLYNTNYGMWAIGPNGKAGNGRSDLCNWNRDWDRSVNIEIFDTYGNVILSQEAEITPSGRYSRANTPHPFKIKAKKKFGYDNYFPFTPFSDKPYNKYQSLKFRSGGNNYQARLKDAALQTIIQRSGLNLDCQSYQPVHHYINGQYQGIINIREPNNKDYAYSNYGFDEDEVDCFKLDHNNGGGGFTLTEGSRDGWDEWVQLAQTAHNEVAYKRICEIVDVEEFANYMAVEFFLANEDWPRNNIKAFRHKDDGRFRFVVFDLDHSFGS